MVRAKHKNIRNRNQGYLALLEPRSLTIASPGYTITLEKQDSNLKSLLMMMIEDIKKDINNSRRTQVNRQKPLKRKYKNPLKNYKKTQPNR